MNALHVTIVCRQQSEMHNCMKLTYDRPDCVILRTCVTRQDYIFRQTVCPTPLSRSSALQSGDGEIVTLVIICHAGQRGTIAL